MAGSARRTRFHRPIRGGAILPGSVWITRWMRWPIESASGTVVVYIGGGTEGDRVDETAGEGLDIPVATGRGPVEVVGTDRLDDVVHNDQRLFGTGEFVHRPPVKRCSTRRSSSGLAGFGVGSRSVGRVIGVPVGTGRAAEGRSDRWIGARAAKRAGRSGLAMNVSPNATRSASLSAMSWFPVRGSRPHWT